MKIWNRFISFALATTLLLTVPLVSFAAGTKNSTSSDFTTVQSASGELLVRAYDLDNGDSVFEQYNDGKLVSRYTVDRSKNVINELVATVYKGNIIKNLIMDCQSYTKYRPNETTGGIFVSWRRKEELPTGA